MTATGDDVKKPQPFETEVALCAAFISALPKDWTAYAETCGWDILLVRSGDGCQIGVQAKLKLNATVLVQAAEDRWDNNRPGPDYRAALVPSCEANALAGLAPHCGLTVIRVRAEALRYNSERFSPGLPDEKHSYSAEQWHERLPAERYKLPEYVPDVAAGASAPLQLTHWKISALRIAALLHATGFVTRDDFKRCHVDIRRWISGGWLKVENGSFVRGDYWPRFELQHPVVWEQILADPAKWQRPPGSMSQQPLFEAAD